MDNQSQGITSAKETNIPQTIAFITLIELDGDVLRGGVLVTDSQGKPLEFRCTSAIQPTTVQKALYGNTLRSHISIELTARPLLNALSEKYDVVIVMQEDFIELRTLIEKPLLMVSKQGSSVALQQESNNTPKSKLLASPSGKFEPLIVTVHWQFADDIDADLSSLFARFDLIEPFKRIDNALKLLHEKGAVKDR